jgi:ABC-type phosphate/phosphonate transport system substrate-binding protein
MRSVMLISAFSAMCTSILAQPTPPVRSARMYVMTSESLFANVNRNDAIASMRVLIDAIGRRKGFVFDVRSDVFASVEEVVPRIREQSVDVLLLDTMDYVFLSASRLVEPIAAGSDHGQSLVIPYVLLVQDGKRYATMRDLRSKRIAVSSRTRSAMGLAWLELVLAGERLPPASQFFASVEDVTKASNCVLPLFFGRVEACVIDSRNFDLMREMNPQLNRLKVIGQSTPILEGLLAMPSKPAYPYKKEFVDALVDIHKDPAGAQMIMLFKTGRLVRATDSDFETAKEMWRDYQRLKNQHPAAFTIARPAPIAGRPSAFGNPVTDKGRQ